MTVHKAHVTGAFQQFPPAYGNAIMHGAGILDGNAIAGLCAGIIAHFLFLLFGA